MQLVQPTLILRGGKVKTTAGFGPFCHGRGEDKFVEFAIVGMQNFVFGSFPPFFAFINKNDVLSDFQHGVHVVGVDDGGDVVLFGDLLDQVVDHNRSHRVETGVRFITEEVFRIHDYGTGNGYTFDHTSTQFGGIEMIHIPQVHPADRS